MQAEPQVQSVARALEVLCCFSSGRAEWGLTEMARHVGVSKSVAHRLLQTLEHYGFVERMPTRRYRLGARTLELGNVFRFDRRFLTRAEPFLRQLAEQTGSIAHLGQLDGREVLELARSSGPGAILFAPHPILRATAHATALGKVLLAGGGEEAFQRYVGPRIRLERFTPHTISDPRELWRQLQEVCTNGYAVSDQESRPGCRCFAVPVKDADGKTVAAVSVSSSVERFGFENLETLLQRLRSAAGAIASAL
jgi:DNA-binding IclR family transcriptional regulator